MRVKPKGQDPDGERLLRMMRLLGITSVQRVETANVYRFEGLKTADVERMASAGRLIDSVCEHGTINEPIIPEDAIKLEVGLKPAVQNPVAGTLCKVARDLSISGLVAASSSREYHVYGKVPQADIDRVVRELLVNKTVEHLITEEPETLVFKGKRPGVAWIPVRDASDSELESLSKALHLFLNLEEMQVIRSHFQKLGREARDGELHLIAQTWSEHCGHKTFKAQVEETLGGIACKRDPLITRIKNTSRRYMKGVLSAFEDNAGVLSFYGEHGISIKWETHNSPSALMPRGGAATGTGGVLRDIVMTGQGADAVTSAYIFCLADPDQPEALMLPGCLHPRYILHEVVAGVAGYGNPMGIPTNMGSINFHQGFRAKPCILVGSNGLIRKKHAKKGVPRPGDLIIAVGGRRGRDGIHGATFSSGAMTESTAIDLGTAVQIGHPIEEKRGFDALRSCREAGWIRAGTDCGAGGLASAIGEIAKDTGGRVFLERVLLKYEGLAPWEVLLSESQECNVICVAPEYGNDVIAECARFNTEATVLGTFTDDGRFFVTYDDETLVDLGMSFLHDGLPQRTMRAKWTTQPNPEPNISEPTTAQEWEERITAVLSHLDVASKLPVIRGFDYGVQGTCALPPIGGVHQDTPSDATIVTPILGKPYGMVISHGITTGANQIDPYQGAILATVEALSNLVAAGGQVKEGETVLCNNYIWPVPTLRQMGSLSLAVDGVCMAVDTFHTPVISGKDSLSSTYRGADGTVLEIPPVVCINAMGKVPDVRRTVSPDFKRKGSWIVLVGELSEDMGASVYWDTQGFVGNSVPKADLARLPKIFTRLHNQIRNQRILACQAIAKGGLITALAKMCFGGDMGAVLWIGHLGEGRTDNLLFNERAGCFLVEVPADISPTQLFGGIPHRLVGCTGDVAGIEKKSIIGLTSRGRGNVANFVLKLDTLKAAWEQPMKEEFGE